MVKLNEVRAHKFSSTATEEKPNLNKTLISGKKITTVKDFLKFQYERFHYFGTDNLMEYGVYKVHGWVFDFKPYLRRFVYKQYGGWSEAYAPNKTALRKVVYGRIDEIREL